MRCKLIAIIIMAAFPIAASAATAGAGAGVGAATSGAGAGVGVEASGSGSVSTGRSPERAPHIGADNSDGLTGQGDVQTRGDVNLKPRRDVPTPRTPREVNIPGGAAGLIEGSGSIR